MQWDDLRVFLAVARTGQFLAAGRSLKLDHATVSRRVGALERDLKARLFVRRTTGVMLTGARARRRGPAGRPGRAARGRAVHEHIVASVAADRRLFQPAPAGSASP